VDWLGRTSNASASHLFSRLPSGHPAELALQFNRHHLEHTRVHLITLTISPPKVNHGE
jgi:hypothetical protein